MPLHQAGYNFHPNDRVWYYDKERSAFKEGTAYQVEVKVYKKLNHPIGSKLTYLVAIDGSPVTIKVKDSDLYLSTNNGLVQPPSTPIYNVTYEFNPEEHVWVIDRVNNGVRYGTVYQTEIKVHRDEGSSTHAKVSYYISFAENSGTVIAKADEVFSSSAAAWAALGITIGPTPTPTLPPEATPLPGSGNLTTVSKINGDTVTLYAGQPVYIDQSNGRVLLASGADARAITFLGFVYDEVIPVGGSGRIITEGTINISNAGWNNIIEGGGVLMPGSRYYLASVGKLSANAPTEGYSRQVGLAASENELDIRTQPTIRL